MSKANQSIPPRARHHKRSAEDAAYLPADVRFAADEPHQLALRVLNSCGDLGVESLRPTFEQAQIRLLPTDLQTPDVAADGWLWLPHADNTQENKRLVERWLQLNANQSSRLICWLPRTHTSGSVDQPDWADDLPADRLLISHSESPARLANEVKSWLKSAPRIPSQRLPSEWVWIVHPEDQANGESAFQQLQIKDPVLRLNLTPKVARELVNGSQSVFRGGIRGVIIYVSQASDWALALASLLWRQSRQAGSKAPIIVLVDWSLRRNHYLNLDLPGIRFLAHEADRPIPIEYQEDESPHSDQPPYKGLRPFEEQDTAFFLGRDQSTDAVLDLLQVNRYVYITGASGDGKSSLVNAGVIPAIKAGLIESSTSRWAVAHFRPEANPLRNLASALMQALHLGQTVESIEENLSRGFSALVDLYRQSQQLGDRRTSNLLLVVDQMEEFFTNAENYSQGQLSPNAYTTSTLLAETIATARRERLPIYTVFTLRSDYLGASSRLPGFSDLVGQSIYFVPQLSSHELESVIQGPAQLLGRRISPRLLRQLLQDAEATQDPLPLLQHALSQIWTCARASDVLDLSHYNSASGLPVGPGVEISNRLQACLNHHAESLCRDIHRLRTTWLAQPAATTDALLECIFRGLIRYDGTAVVRRSCTLAELLEHTALLDFTDEQILVVLRELRSPPHTFIRPYAHQSPESNALEPHTLIDLTHESLLRNWNRLEKWAADEVRDVNRLKELKAQADRWTMNRRSSRYLLSPGMATFFDRWLRESRPHPRWVASHLYAGVRSTTSTPLQQAEQTLQSLRQFVDRSMRRNRLIRHFAISSLSIIGLLGILSALLYWNYYHEAESSLAKSRRIIRQERALAEQQRLINNNLARDAENTRLLAEQQRLINEQRLLQEEQRRKQAMGQALEASKAARLAQIEREMAQREKLIAENLRQAAEEQRQLADRQARLERETADQATRSAEQARIERKNAEIQRNEALLFQSRYFAAMAHKQIQARKTDIGLLLALKALPQNLAFPDRPYEPLAEAALYNAAHAMVNESPYPVLLGHKNVVTSVHFLPNGNELVTTSQDRTARGWDLRTGRPTFTFTHNNIVRRAESSADGRWLLTLTDDYQVQVWNLQTKSPFRSLGNESDLMRLARISPNGRWVVTVSGSGHTRVWELESGQQLMYLPVGSEVRSIVFSPQSDYLLLATAADGVQVVNLLSGRLESVLAIPGGGANCAVFSPNLQLVVTASDDHQVRVWNWRSGQLLQQLYGHSGAVVDLAFAPHGRWFVSAGSEGNARVWQTNGVELAVLSDAAGPNAQILISHDGQRIASLNSNRQLKLWDGSSFLLLATFEEKPLPGFGLSFHPSGRFLALAGYDFRTRVYQVLPAGQDLINFSINNLKRRDLQDEELQQYLTK